MSAAMGRCRALFESCDDGNTVDDGNGCDAFCQANNVCGDGTVQGAVEACDDGNTVDADGVTDTCNADCSGRYVDNGNGTVTDTWTGLVWLENANCVDLPMTDGVGRANWDDANAGAALLAHGTCGLTDGSSPGDWRLPTAGSPTAEWERAVAAALALGCSVNDAGDPPSITNAPGTGCHAVGPAAFTGLQSATHYWSSTEDNDVIGWLVGVANGATFIDFKVSIHLVWPVRPGP